MFGISFNRKSEDIEPLMKELEAIQSRTRSKINLLEYGSYELNQLQQSIFRYLVTNQVISYPINQRTFIDKGYSYNPHIYTVINFIARNKAQAKFFVTIVKDKKQLYEYISFKNEGNLPRANQYRRKAVDIVDPASNQLAKIFRQPNKNQGWSEYMFEKTGYHELMGQSFVYGLTPEGFQDNFFSSIYIAPSPLVEIVSGGWMEPVKAFKINFGYDRSSDIDKGKILHQKMWNPMSDSTGGQLYGLSPLQPLLRTLKRSNEAVDANLAYLVNGAPAGIMSNDSERAMTTEERKRSQELLNSEFGGGVNVNKVLQSSTKVSWQQIGLPLADLQLLESNKVDLQTISNGYGIDVIIFDPDKSAYNNKITAEKAAWQNTIIPKLNEERDGYNTWLVPGYSELDKKEYFVDYDVSHIACLQTDLAELAKRVYEGVKVAVYSPNEAAEILGGEPDPNNEALNKKYIMQTLRPVDEPYQPTKSDKTNE